MEGTYPLPEAQLDRFMFNVKVKYPSIQEELLVVKGTTGTHSSAGARAILKADELIRLQDLVRGVPVADSVMLYAVRLVAASRPGESKEIEGVHKVPDVRGQPEGLAIPDPRGQGSGDPGGQVSRRFSTT